MAGKKANTKTKCKAEEKKSKPPVRLPTLKTLGDIPTSRSNQSEDAQVGTIDLINIREFIIQKTKYYEKLSSSLLNLELKSTGKIFRSPSPVDGGKKIVNGKEKNELQLIPSDEQERKKRLDIKLKGISKLLSTFDLSSDNSFKVVWLCCIHMHSSYFILQCISTISSTSYFVLTSLDQAVIGCAFQLLGYYHGKRLISDQELKKFHSYRTDKSTIAKRQKHEKHKGLVKASAIKMFNQFTLTTVKNNISEAAFVNMIKDDLSPLKMSEKKIKTLLHELQDEGQIKFDPRKAKPGKMLHFSNNGKDVT